MTGSDRSVQRVLWPRGASTASVTPLAERPATLEGATIGELWDDLFRGDEIFPILRDELRQRFPGVRFVEYKTFGSTHGPEERKVLAELPERMRQHGVTAVISGMAC